MPELPEVESVRRYLHRELTGTSLQRIDPVFPGVFSNASSTQPPVLPCRFVDSHRKGKMLALQFEGNQTLLVHLRMTGRLYFPQPGQELLPHTHVALHFSEGRTLAFSDPRRFGRLVWHRGTPIDKIPELLRLGPDGLSLPREDFVRLLGFRNRMMKPLLLDQSVLSGMGNIYVDEALFQAGIHPRQISGNLSKKKIEALWEATLEILERAIENGGSTIRDFVGSSGESGNYQKQHRVYGRGGLECTSCGGTLRKIEVAQRGTTYCPICQKLRYRKKATRVKA